MNPRARMALLVAGVAAGVVAVFGVIGSRPDARTSLPASAKTPTLPADCLETPPQTPTPDWFPKDLPMPAGSYVNEVPEASAGLRRVVFTVSGTLRDFVRHALGVWPEHGWTLGRGESEPGEAEDQFLKGKNRYGLFKAQSVYCDTSKTWVLIVLSDPTTLGSTAPSPKPSR